MNRETLKTPKLIEMVAIKTKEINPFFNLNIIVLVVFLIFFFFFLINCRNGIFTNIDVNPIPYNMVKQ